MTRPVRIAEIDWTEYERRVREEQPVVILPVGSLEQHGPHLPMNCDAVIPTALSERVAARTGDLVAPTLCYGYKSQPKSGGGNQLPRHHQPRRRDPDPHGARHRLRVRAPRRAPHGGGGRPLREQHVPGRGHRPRVARAQARGRPRHEDRQDPLLGVRAGGDLPPRLARGLPRLAAGARGPDGDLGHAAPLSRAGGHDQGARPSARRLPALRRLPDRYLARALDRGALAVLRRRRRRRASASSPTTWRA